MSTGSVSAAPAPSRRRPLLFVVLGAAALAAAGYLAWWALVGRFYETTDDAYVGGDIVYVTSAVAGIVTGIDADDTQPVARGAALVELDDADALVQRDHAEAQLARTVRSVRGQFAQLRQAQARVAELKVLLAQAQADRARRRGLVEQGAVGGEELAHLDQGIAAVQAQLAAAAAQVQTAQAPIDNTVLASHPAVLDAAAAVRDAALALRRSRLTAPVAGIVAMRSVQVGEHVAAGERLLSIVPLDGVWVDANFKETQLERMRLGQPVALTADLYGSGFTYHGRLAGLSAGSGSAFALIPPQNASGNWIKVVQRLPVRVLVQPDELREHPLRQGLSMQVKVDVHDGQGLPAATPVRNAPIPRRDSDGGDPAVEARIRQIIEANSGAG
jgi:membrane fusion protein (multidrug efflux system)